MISKDINCNNLVYCLCLVWIMSQGSSVVTTRREHVRSPVLNKMSFLPISPRAAMIFKLLFQWQTLLLRKRGGLPPLGCYCLPSRPPRPTAPSSPNLTASPSASRKQDRAAFVRGCSANVTRCTWGAGAYMGRNSG